MNYVVMKNCDIANGPGCRISLFVSGCRRHCKECFNSIAWPFDAGQKFTEDDLNHLLELIGQDWVAGFTVLGGEPFEPENRLEVDGIISAVRNKFPTQSIWAYTGFKIEELTDDISRHIISKLDILVDGEFIVDKKDLRLQFCGSTNQRVIDIGLSKQAGRLILHNNYDFKKIED